MLFYCSNEVVIHPLRQAMIIINGSDIRFKAATLGTTSHFEGNILGQTGINLQTGASINGRRLAQTAVTLQMNTVTQPR
jgi:hypothetical protein